MSIHVLSWVLRESPTEKAQRLVLISLANYAHDDGSNSHPGVATLMRDSRLRSRRSIQNALRGLEEAGHITPTGTTRGGTTIYTVEMAGANFSAEEGEEQGAQKLRGGGAKTDNDPAQTLREGGANGDGALHTEPSSNQTAGTNTGDDDSEVIRQLFDFWRSMTGRNGSTQLTDKRRTAIRARIREGATPELIRRAIAGAAGSNFHRGENPRGIRYDQLERILKNRDELERFAEMPPAREPATTRNGAAALAPIAEPSDDEQATWAAIRERLRRALPEASWDLYIADLELAGARSGALVITGPAGTLGWLERRYMGLIQEAAKAEGLAKPIQLADHLEVHGEPEAAR
jgi:hypothetical protein